MSGHTPGPWEHYPANNYAGFAIAPLGTLPTLAAVERPRGNTNTLNVTAFNFPGQTEANARLMAAAPEMLEALLSVRSSTEWSCMEADTQEAVEAAIAKATGEAK